MILIGIAALMVGLGVLLQSGKGSFLISGYNMMPKEQQAQVDIRGLSRLMAYYMYFLALLFIGMAVFEWLNEPNGLIGCVVIILLSTVVIVFKSQKFYAGVTYEAGKGRFGRGTKWASTISIVTVVGVGIIIYFSVQPTKLAVTEETLEIGGMYGGTFELAALEELVLVDEIPAISMRTNGSALGSKLIGHFKLESGEKVKLFIDKSKPPFITFVVDGQRYYMNEPEADETNALFEQLNK